jgi:hypothetical protein
LRNITLVCTPTPRREQGFLRLVGFLRSVGFLRNMGFLRKRGCYENGGEKNEESEGEYPRNCFGHMDISSIENGKMARTRLSPTFWVFNMN